MAKVTETLTFAALRAANLDRLPEFLNARGEIAHPGGDVHDKSLSFWSNALCGEAGEAANFVKKYDRGDFAPGQIGEELFRAKLRREIADVVCYADLLALRINTNLADAVAEKFNEVSVKIGSAVRLGDVTIVERPPGWQAANMLREKLERMGASGVLYVGVKEDAQGEFLWVLYRGASGAEAYLKDMTVDQHGYRISVTAQRQEQK